MLHLLTNLTPANIKLKCTGVLKKVVDGIKQIVAHETLLAYPDLKKSINTYENGFKLGALIIKEGKTIALCSHKIAGPHIGYTVMENYSLVSYKLSFDYIRSYWIKKMEYILIIKTSRVKK